ncbi:amidohydrolase [Biformimicrobium ophioploci]|uniref:Amidohydrolase n=1 Tax=Biformimicrobium ophioploci TaxID=3036711 RepID=A0ABQ6LV34_9GAMM|nr:amidohydrolase [Microbulbifer sp. NKW57]GMG85939.1 amidohydrolase [Microbulbifer sp. NKW57]
MPFPNLARCAGALIATLLFAGCAEKPAADRVLVGGDVITLSPNNDIASAVALQGDRIFATGSDADMLALAGPHTEVIPLEGRAVLPGFVAAHEHPAISAVFSSFIDLSGFSHSSNASVWRTLEDAIEKAQPGDWIYGMGLDPVLVPDLKMPDRDFLDRIAPHNPVFLVTQSMHTAWVNSAALRAIGIDESVEDPGNGSFFGRDESGRLNGMLVEKDAIGPFVEQHKRFWRILPAYESTLDQLRAQGYTSVASLGYNLPAMLARWAALDGVSPRLRQFFYIRGDNIEALPTTPQRDNDFFRILGAKYWYDGSPYSGTMLLEAPYLDTALSESLGIPHGSHGEAVIPPAALARALASHNRNDWQFAVHSQGDRAGRELLGLLSGLYDGLDDAGKQAFRNRRHRIEHGVYLDKTLLPELAALGITPSFHINHLYYYGEALRNDLLGAARAEQLLPLRSAFELGMRPTLHADSPMFPPDPFSLMQTAITRKTRSGEILGAAEALSPLQALHAMTINGAYQLGLDDRLGSIEPGKLADLVILDRNPLQVDPQQWHTLRVERTILAGETE